MPVTLPVLGMTDLPLNNGVFEALEQAERDVEMLAVRGVDVPPSPPIATSTDAPASLLPLEIVPKRAKGPRLWTPKRVTFTPAALDEPWGLQILRRVESLGLEVEKLTQNRVTGLKGDDERDTYRRSKSTLAVVTAPKGQMKLQPIPPSADWQFHIAEGCPAHCQYCYLAGSLSGPPVVRAFANLPAILENTKNYAGTFEVSCYTDPLGIEHLTGSLSECIRFFGTRDDDTQLRWVSKFDNVDGLIGLAHNNKTRCRLSMNAPEMSKKFEGGTASVAERIAALRKLALPQEQGGGGYPVGIVIAPIMPFPGWEEGYSTFLDDIANALNFPCDLTFELITHRFTPGSKEVLLGWYPATTLDLAEEGRDIKRNKFGGTKYVYNRPTMKDLRAFFETEIKRRFPTAHVMYFT
jgi:spore photoproduct lyase